MSGNQIVTLVVTLLKIMVGLTLFINKTKTGSAMLAVSEDKGAAELMGVNVNKTISLTFAIGSALAAGCRRTVFQLLWIYRAIHGRNARY